MSVGLRDGGYALVDRHQAALLVWGVLAIGFTLGLLPLSRPPRGIAWPLAALAALTAWNLLALAWSESPERTLDEVARLVALGSVLALAWSLLGRRSWRAAAAGVAFSSLGVCLLAFLSRVAPAAFAGDVSSEVFHSHRLAFPLGYWNALGAWAAMSFVMGLGWSAFGKTREARALALASLPVAGGVIYMTYSRAALAGLALGIIVLAVLVRERRLLAVHGLVALAASALLVAAIRAHPGLATGRDADGAGVVVLAALLLSAGCASVALWYRHARQEAHGAPEGVGRAVAAVLAVGLVAVVVAAGPSVASSIRSSFADDPQPPSADPAARLTDLGGQRHELWGSALRAFGDEPLEGIGPGAFELWWARDPASTTLVKDAHSLYLEVLAEGGLVGFLLLMAFLGGCAVVCLSRIRALAYWRDRGIAAALLAAYAVFVFQAGVDWLWEVTAVPGLALLAVAVATAATAEIPRRRYRPPAGRRAMMALAAVAAAAVQVPGLVAADRIDSSQAALAAGKPDLALALADEAVEAHPWTAAERARRAQALARLGRYDEAAADLSHAVEEEPTNWRLVLLLAVVELRGGDAAAAEATYAEARGLRPLLPADGGPLLRGLADDL